MITKLKSLNKSIFFSALLKLTSSTAISQIIVMLSIPFLSRIYAPSDFGVFGLINAIVLILSGIASLRYEQAIYSCEDQEKLPLVKICFISSLFVCFLSFFLMLILKNISLIDIELRTIDIFVIAFSSFFVSGFNILNNYFSSNSNFSEISLSNIIRSITLVFSQLSLFLVKDGLIIGYLLAQIIAFIYLAFTFNTKKALIDNKQSKKTVALKYFDFAKYNLPHTLLNVFTNNLPYLALSSFGGHAVVGYYTMAARFMQVPQRFISNSLRQILSWDISKNLENSEYVYNKIIKTTLILFISVIIPYATVYAFGVEIFSFFLGGEWAEAGEIAGYMCIWFVFGFTNTPSIVYLTIKRKLKTLLYLEIVQGGLRILSFYVVYSSGSNYQNAVLFYCLASCLFNILVIIIATLKSHSDRKN